MPLIFIGGARGSGKSTVVESLCKSAPQIEHVQLSLEVRNFYPANEFEDAYVGMRHLTPKKQCEAVSLVLNQFSQRHLSRLLVIEGHFVSSSIVDGYESFFPCFGQNVQLFSKMYLIKTSPIEIVRRRMLREVQQLTKTINLQETMQEYLAEGLEARHLNKRYGVDLIFCADHELIQSVYGAYGEYLCGGLRQPN